MDKTKLAILRGKLLAAESGFSAGLYTPGEVRTMAAEMESLYPDMPDEERARVEVLKKSGGASGPQSLPS